MDSELPALAPRYTLPAPIAFPIKPERLKSSSQRDEEGKTYGTNPNIVVSQLATTLDI